MRITKINILGFLSILGFIVFPLNVKAISVTPSPSYSGSYTVNWFDPTYCWYQKPGYECMTLWEKIGAGAWSSVAFVDAITSKGYSGKGINTYQYRMCIGEASTLAAAKTTCTYVFDGPVSVSVTAPSAPATPTGPTTDYSGGYTISWSGVTGATSYELQENLNGAGWSTIQSNSNTSMARTGRSIGTWNYRVRACSNSGTFCSSYSSTKSVTVSAPSTPATPTGPTTDYSGGYTISWTGVTGATSYELQENQNGGSWSTIQSNSNTSMARTSRSIGTWNYRVRACSNSGTFCSSYSSTKSVTVTAPTTPTTPSGPTEDGDGAYTISWGSVTGATSYTLQERLNGGSWSTIHDASGTSKARSSLGEGTWGYQIRACSSVGCSSYSSVKSVVVIYPPGVPGSITAPANDDDGDYTVSWGSASGGGTITYTLQERVNAGSWSTIQDTSALYKDVEGKSNGTYDYRVRACNSGGCSDWIDMETVAVLHLPGVPGSLNISATEGIPGTFIVALIGYREDEIWWLARDGLNRKEMDGGEGAA